jgi:hypothetical protein
MSALLDRERAAARQLALACVLVAAGGVLLGVQVDGSGALVGTGYASLGIGTVVALIVVLLQAVRSQVLPRDGVTTLSAISGFCGLAFVASGVLAPGGAWMFFELLLLVVVLARSDGHGRGTIALLAAMLVFKLWIAYQGSQHRWQVMTIDVPILSSIPLSFLEPIQHVELGEFSPRELGFPPAGLDFPISLALWSAGFALTVVGLVWRARAALEHENDRVHATIDVLPPNLARAVSRILPEDQWRALGLHGLSDRMLHKRIEQLVVERVAARGELERALGEARLLESTNPGGFAGELYAALEQHETPRRPES